MIIALVISGKKNYAVIPDQEIIHLQARDNYTIVYCRNKDQHMLCKCLSTTLEELDTKLFVRVHQSHAVNIREVLSFDKGRSGYVHLKNGAKVPMSYEMKKNLRAALKNRIPT